MSDETTIVTPRTIGEVAKWLAENITTDTRNDGATFYKFKDGFDYDSDGPNGWVFELIHDAHGSMLPDDYVYEYVADALDTIADNWEDGADVDDLMEHGSDADVYTHDLLKWMGSHLDRFGRVEEALIELGTGDNCLSKAMMYAQAQEREEVLANVFRAIEEHCEGLEGEGEEDA